MLRRFLTGTTDQQQTIKRRPALLPIRQMQGTEAQNKAAHDKAIGGQSPLLAAPIHDGAIKTKNPYGALILNLFYQQ